MFGGRNKGVSLAFAVGRGALAGLNGGGSTRLGGALLGRNGGGSNDLTDSSCAASSAAC